MSVRLRGGEHNQEGQSNGAFRTEIFAQGAVGAAVRRYEHRLAVYLRQRSHLTRGAGPHDAIAALPDRQRAVILTTFGEIHAAPRGRGLRAEPDRRLLTFERGDVLNKAGIVMVPTTEGQDTE